MSTIVKRVTKEIGHVVRRAHHTKSSSFRAMPALAIALSLTPCVSPRAAHWTSVAPGIAYRDFSLPGPVRVHVVRADRQVKTWTIDTMTSLGEVKGGLETVPGMADRYDDSITPDGHRYDIKAAINGDYHSGKTGVALSGEISAGWFVKRYTDYSGSSGFVWTSDRRCFLGGNVQNNKAFQHVRFADNAEMKINRLNESRTNNDLVLYTWHYAANTGTDNDGVEVLVHVSAPLDVMPSSPGVKGEIIRVRQNTGSSLLPFNDVVLSAQGTAAAELLKHAHVGEHVYISLGLKDNGREDIGLPPGDWHDAYGSLGGPKYIVVNGKVPRADWEVKAARYARQGRKHGSVIKDPRTAIAFDDRYVYFLVIDGRSKASVGMTFTEAGFFCKDVLKATNATLQDGGGSSTLWVDGKVRNTPSGKGKDEKQGVLRAVANGYFIAEVLPPKRSDAFKTGQSVRLKNGGDMRLGPGMTFGSAGEPSADDKGVIVSEPLNGIYAKGTYWWHCRFGEIEGWAPQEALKVAQ